MAFLNFLRTVVLPLLLAGTIYALLTFAIIPLYRSHRQRYAQYLPINTISNTTSRTSSFLRDRILARIFLPSSWPFRSRFRRTEHAVDGADDNEDDSNSLFGSEEGEGMVGFDVDGRTPNPSIGRGNGARPAIDRDVSDRRLSRELEEGFRDDSDEEDNSASNPRRPGIAR